MYPRRDDGSGLYGYWRGAGWAITPGFAYANAFQGGYAAVQLLDGRPCLVSTDGARHPLEAICGGKPVDDEEFSFSGFGGYDSLPPSYAAACIVRGRRREWGLIDLHLNYRPLPRDVFDGAEYVRPCGERVVIHRKARRKAGALFGLYNLNDERLELPVEYSGIHPSAESFWVVVKSVGEYRTEHHCAYYDVSKRELLPGWFTSATPFSCGLGAVRVGGWDARGRSYFVDETLCQVFDDFDEVNRFAYGLAAVCKGDDVGYIDTTGRMRLVLPYERLTPFNEFGLAIANRNEAEWDLDIIDRQGKARLGGLETAVFWEGDFPHYEVTIDGEEHLFTPDMTMLF